MRTSGAGPVLGVLLSWCGLACQSTANPVVSTPAPSAGPVVAVTGASVDATGHVIANYTLTQDGKGLTGDAASATRPTWTLAGLAPDPATGTPSNSQSGVLTWKSFLLTSSTTIPSLPIDGPGTPPEFVLANTKQPGSETSGTTQDLGGGNFQYTYKNAIPAGTDPSHTIRVGVYLGGATGTAQTSSTFDFVPNGGPVQARELVLDSNCNVCHNLVAAHGGARTGTKLCVTCHNVVNADPDTVDPAALLTATPATNPNPLDLGRLVHRIHRGNELPTLFDATTGAPVVGQRYSVVGFRSSETVYGQVVNRTDNQQPAVALATGVRFPQDLRNCDVCHAAAAQASNRFADISRRTCAGCHPDVWFGTDAIPSTDKVHTTHPAGPQADDTACAGCHVPATPGQTVPADITQIHVAPRLSPHWNGLTAKIIAVTGLTPGQVPTVTFTISDRDGNWAGTPLNAPSPATEPPGPSQSPVPRKLTSFTILLSGPSTDYLTGNAPFSQAVPLTTVVDGNGNGTYTFTTPIPTSATGTWAVGLETRRSLSPTPTGAWPFTGEGVTEYADNPVVYVDTAVGTLGAGAPVPRRTVIARDSCNGCHLDLNLHGGLRHNPEYCVMCHAPDATDWATRPKAANGNVNLRGTFDDIEERSINFKVLIHRIHTGEGDGSAELTLAAPFIVYGRNGSLNFFDDVRFPGNLARCSTCHAGQSYQIDSLPTDVQPTWANETASIFHSATPAHPSSETPLLPVASACTGCHGTNAAVSHAASNTINGKENCITCHGKIGYMSVDIVHGITPQ
jgi:OmcA/MtrC family decaheme c-type cytochrome